MPQVEGFANAIIYLYFLSNDLEDQGVFPVKLKDNFIGSKQEAFTANQIKSKIDQE
jgi:hypothetical protein